MRKIIIKYTRMKLVFIKKKYYNVSMNNRTIKLFNIDENHHPRNSMILIHCFISIRRLFELMFFFSFICVLLCNQLFFVESWKWFKMRSKVYWGKCYFKLFNALGYYSDFIKYSVRRSLFKKLNQIHF